ncbi:hypothetical protein EDB85DRAFT_1918475 [Lactarius pseudohatsudake]|nr:hypothetical protein EDB85DRAFT_1918475 [Lactarius pseudohatsudake]
MILSTSTCARIAITSFAMLICLLRVAWFVGPSASKKVPAAHEKNRVKTRTINAPHFQRAFRLVKLKTLIHMYVQATRRFGRGDTRGDQRTREM